MLIKFRQNNIYINWRSKDIASIPFKRCCFSWVDNKEKIQFLIAVS